jgi:hypothetical protein
MEVIERPKNAVVVVLLFERLELLLCEPFNYLAPLRLSFQPTLLVVLLTDS